MTLTGRPRIHFLREVVCRCGIVFTTYNPKQKFHSQPCAVSRGVYPKGYKHSEEKKRQLSEAHKGQIAWNKGLKGKQTAWNKGLKGRQTAWNKGRSWPTEVKLRIALTLVTASLPDYARPHKIYYLSDPRDNAIRYVGFTINPHKRLKHHLLALGQTHCANWIRSLQNVGLVPTMTTQCVVCSKSEACRIEIALIKILRARGTDLTNIMPGGEGGDTRLWRVATHGTGTNWAEAK